MRIEITMKNGKLMVEIDKQTALHSIFNNMLTNDDNFIRFLFLSFFFIHFGFVLDSKNAVDLFVFSLWHALRDSVINPAIFQFYWMSSSLLTFCSIFMSETIRLDDCTLTIYCLPRIKEGEGKMHYLTYIE